MSLIRLFILRRNVQEFAVVFIAAFSYRYNWCNLLPLVYFHSSM